MAWAATSCSSNRKVLLHLFLDGGMDSASLLVPRNLQSYFDKRPNIRINSPLIVDAKYGIHPRLTNLHNMLMAGNAAVVNKVGYPGGTRSHEDSKNVYSRAVRNAGTDNTGWAGRFGDTYCRGNNNIASVFSFRGNVPDVTARQGFVATTAGSLSSFGYTNDTDSNDSTYRRIMSRNTRPLEAVTNNEALALQRAWDNIDASVDTIRAVNTAYTSPITYSNDSLSQRFRDAAKLIASNENPSIILLSQGGYDTHGSEPQALDSLFTNLNNAIGSFWADMLQMGRSNDVVVQIFTEFGRNTFENSGQGTDHGNGTIGITLGSNINGGIHGPDYTEADFATKRWLDSSVDFREMLYEAVGQHLGVDPEPIFPEAFSRSGINLIR